MAQQTRLHKRGNVYYFRARIPLNILHLYAPQTEIKFSLRTSSLKEAKALVNQFSVKYDAEFDLQQQALESKDALPTVLRIVDEATAKAIGRLWVRQVVDGDEQIRQMVSDEEFAARETDLATSEQFMRQALARGKVDIVEPVMTQFLGLKGIQLDCDAAGRQLLCKHFLNAYTEGLQHQRRRSQGEIVIGAEIAPDASTFQVTAAQPGRLTLDELFTDWRDAVPGRNTNSVAGVHACVREFDRFMKSKAPSSYTRADFKGFKKHLEERGNSPRTVGKKLGFLSTILSYAVQDEKLTANPATGLLKAAPGASKKTRVPYNAKDVQNILGSKIYVSSARPAAGGGEAVVWLPALGLLTGGRLEELAQLRVDDVGFVDGLGHYMHITDCDDEQHVKTDESRRRMPVHPDLLKAGFMRYVRRLQDAGETRLFPGLTQDSKGRWSGNWSKFWGRYARQEVGITDRRKVFHSFRHLFKDLLRETECRDEVSDVLMGHSDGSMGSKYGSAPGNYPLAPLFKAINEINLKRHGITLPVIEAE